MENEKNFHEVMGGRRRQDNRFFNKEKAREIQDNLVILKKRGVNMVDLKEKIGLGISTISMAAGGRAGDKLQERFRGLSSTDYILEGLKELVDNG